MRCDELEGRGEMDFVCFCMSAEEREWWKQEFPDAPEWLDNPPWDDHPGTAS
jgi:hypothetical protein